MEGGKGELQRQCCKGLLLVFCVFTLVLALLEGAGLVFIYTNFDTRITALEKGSNVVTLKENPSEGSRSSIRLFSPFVPYRYPFATCVLFISCECNHSVISPHYSLPPLQWQWKVFCLFVNSVLFTN